MLLSQVVPAVLFCCSPIPAATEAGAAGGLAVRTDAAPAATLDLFFFDREAPGLLDAHQRTEGSIPNRWEGVSRSGEKTLFLVANLPESAYSWEEIRSRTMLEAKEISLAGEDPARPVMTAQVQVKAGETAEATLQPLLAEIRLQSLCCDFHGRPYAGARLENIRIYLTRACDRCRLDGKAVASRMDGRSGEELSHPEMLLAGLDGAVGDRTVFPDIRLYAYPNPAREETLGTPQTRLVIEGTLLGETYYYPIPVSPLEGGKSHLFNVVITRTGTLDPEIPVTRDMVRLHGAVAPWNEMPPQIQVFP